MSKHSWQARMMGLKDPVDLQKIPDETETLLLVRGKNMYGDPIFCYLKITVGNYRRIKPLLDGKEKFDLRTYGDVVAVGMGEPTDELKAELSETYNSVFVDVADGES